jgi:hypothetical protein
MAEYARRGVRKRLVRVHLSKMKDDPMTIANIKKSKKTKLHPSHKLEVSLANIKKAAETALESIQ